LASDASSYVTRKTLYADSGYQHNLMRCHPNVDQ
jgi:hypothetical protein